MFILFLVPRQEFDLRAALPLGVLNGALNAGVAAGVIYPLERGSTGSVPPLSKRFYLGVTGLLYAAWVDHRHS
jgi:hypothetical protein